MVVEIDWENTEKQIRHSFNLTDSDVETCLAAFAHAKKLYPGFHVPERLCLTNSHGRILYTIITRGAKPTSVSVGPERSITASKKILCVVGAAVVVGSVIYFLYY